MKKIGLFYATKAERTSWVAEKIQKEFGEDKIEVVPIEQAWQNDFAAYDCFIVGASTWFDGELPTYWDELLPELRTMKLKGKKVAIFGLGWLSIWIISPNRRKRKSKHGANRSKKSSRNSFVSLYKIVTLSDANSDGICYG